MLTPISYPATIQEVEPGEFLVTFADVPQAGTAGATYEEALAEAPEALSVALEVYLDRGLPVPAWRPAAAGEVDVALEPEVAARVLLVSAMADQRLTKVALAERLGRDEKTVRRIIAGKGATFAMTMKALQAVGLRPALAS